MMTAAAFALRLDHVRHTSEGRYSARCPAHKDWSPSLTFRDGYRGLLIRCWAGCALTDITAALGLRLSDLFPNQGARRERFAGRAHRQDEWAVVWLQTIRRASEQGRWADEWAPLWAVSDFIRHSLSAANRARAIVTRMGEKDQRSWPLLEETARIETYARWVETELDAIMAAGRIA